MIALTKYVLKRPITTIMAILCLIFFGYSSVTSSELELSPEMDMPMLLVMTTYSGASPEDVNELITKKIEDKTGSLSGLKSVTSNSSEGVSTVMLEYEYGTDIDEAYDDLKKQIDLVTQEFPEDADEPVVAEMNMDSMPDITLSIDNASQEDLYSYVNEELVPEFEKISAAADVTIRGGSQKYIKIELIPEKVEQYKTSMSQIASDIADADLSYPAGDIQVGSQELSISTRLDYDTEELLKEIPLTTQDGSTVYLEDVARIYSASDSADSIARYNGEDTISISITKQQSATAIELSDSVHEIIDQLTAEDPDLNIVVVDDTADSILSSLSSVAETIIMAIGISMVIIWLFFGDIKASLIVGSSIPVSILSALILMNLMGLTLNVITLSALTLGVGMMVDNSIVVLESCFRCTEKRKGGFIEYFQDALEGTDLVNSSILGGTLTTCVVFLPLAFLEGMTGQMFKPLGFTIVFCLSASYISALTVVPLCYMMYKPVEREKAPLSRPVARLQDRYRGWMKKILKHPKMVMGISLGLLVFSFFIATKLRMELMASDDNGEVTITVDTRPGLVTEDVDTILKQVEEIIAQDPNLDSYMTSYGGGGMSSGDSATITGYLKDDRDMETEEVANQWKQQLAEIKNCDISVDVSGSMSMMSSFGQSFEVILKGTIRREVVEPNLTSSVSIGLNSQDQSMNEEFSALFGAIGTAVFLIFVVMAAQFESPKFSLMVMTTIPFSLIGSFGLLYMADSAISMISLIGFLMLIGTVVNSGILYVDTVNQYRGEMDLETALIEAGATRMKPIFMTTSTTILSMIPMAMAWGSSGDMTRGLALVNIGGLTASTILALLMLPVYYKVMSSKTDEEKRLRRKKKQADRRARSEKWVKKFFGKKKGDQNDGI